MEDIMLEMDRIIRPEVNMPYILLAESNFKRRYYYGHRNDLLVLFVLEQKLCSLACYIPQQILALVIKCFGLSLLMYHKIE